MHRSRSRRGAIFGVLRPGLYLVRASDGARSSQVRLVVTR
jgi:hypothetical protein